jgi:hypothetical protein
VNTQLIGFLLIASAAFVMTFTVGTVVIGMAIVMNRRDVVRGGCRGPGCRLEAGRHGCTWSGAVDGPAASDLTTLARAGWVDIETVRTFEGK